MIFCDVFFGGDSEKMSPDRARILTCVIAQNRYTPNLILVLIPLAHTLKTILSLILSLEVGNYILYLLSYKQCMENDARLRFNLPPVYKKNLHPCKIINTYNTILRQYPKYSSNLTLVQSGLSRSVGKRF